jgi:hypothetical protein
MVFVEVTTGHNNSIFQMLKLRRERMKWGFMFGYWRCGGSVVSASAVVLKSRGHYAVGCPLAGDRGRTFTRKDKRTTTEQNFAKFRDLFQNHVTVQKIILKSEVGAGAFFALSRSLFCVILRHKIIGPCRQSRCGARPLWCSHRKPPWPKHR